MTQYFLLQTLYRTSRKDELYSTFGLRPTKLQGSLLKTAYAASMPSETKRKTPYRVLWEEEEGSKP